MSGTSKLPPGDDPYRILGVAPTADLEEITRAYRRLLRQHHPDTAPGHTSLDHHRLADVLAAYRQLRRSRHTDNAGAATNGVPVTVHHHDQQMPRQQRRQQSTEQVWLETSRTTRSAGPGRRRILIAHRGIDTDAAVTITAEQAITGDVVTVAAPDDPVDGRRLHNIRVRIPPGTRDGQTLRIAGHGTPGRNGGAPGDLRLTVYHAHP